MYAAKDIASRFVHKGLGDNKPVTQMQIQKLVYFAHGAHLAKYNTKLVTDEIQAWKFGPVIPVLYDVYKLYGADKITDTHFLSEFLGRAIPSQEKFVPLDDNAQKTIDATWNFLKDIDAIHLSNWTHKEGSPWYETYYTKGQNAVIEDKLIKEYFIQHVIKKD